MTALTPEGDRLIADLSQRYGLSQGAVRALLDALVAGGGTQAQFSHPDLGGMGQWSRGGMTMVGDMFNNALKAQVDGVLSELSGAMGTTALVQRQTQGQYGGFQGGFQGWGGGGQWWPEGLGSPSSTGTQNDMGYAIFPEARRLAVRRGGRVRLFDTGEHWISGVSQQQGGHDDLRFSSQFGPVGLGDLREVGQGGEEDALAQTGGSGSAPLENGLADALDDLADDHLDDLVSPPEPGSGPMAPSGVTPGAPSNALPGAPSNAPSNAASGTAPGARGAPPTGDDIFSKLERLADLHARGILTDAEFQAKKADLLDRL